MINVRSQAGEAVEVLGPRSRRRGQAAGRRRPRFEALETRLALSGAGTTLDVSYSPYFLQERLRAVPTDSSYFGWSFDATADGSMLAVAAPDTRFDGVPGMMGVVDVYRRTDREWTQTAQLTPPGGDASRPNYMGEQVALSDDGSTLVVLGGSGVGTDSIVSLYIYVNSADGWRFTQKLDEAYGYGVTSGYAASRLSISADGGVIAFGSAFGHYSEAYSSRVQVYSRAGESWSRTAELAPPDPSEADSFGASVALSADGTTLAVGAGLDFGQSDEPGAVFIYHASAGTWAAPDRIDPAPGRQNFGDSIALSADGKTLLAANMERIAPFERFVGAAYVYRESGGEGWTETARLLPPTPGTYDIFYAQTLALSPDGETAVVSTIDTADTRPVGHVFDLEGGAWTFTTTLDAPGYEGLYGAFATPAVVTDTDVFARGAGSFDGVGSVYVFHRPRSLEVVLDPTDTTTSPRTPTTFFAGAAGAAVVSTRWQTSTDGLSWTDVPGAVFDSYTVTPKLSDSGRMYRAVFNAAGGATLTTKPATMTVREATPIVTITSSLNPRPVAKSQTFYVRITSDGSTPLVPTGNVDLNVGGSGFSGVLVNGVATIDAHMAPYDPGAYTITATYSGSSDETFGEATGSMIQVVSKSVTTAGMYLDDDTPVAGQPVTITAILDHERQMFVYEPPMTGLIAFYDGPDLIGVRRLDANNQSYISLPYTFDARVHSVRWTYYGDDYYQSVTSDLMVFDVPKADSSVQVHPTYISSIFYYGQSPIYDVKLWPSIRSEFQPSGQVAFSIGDYQGAIPSQWTDQEGRLTVSLPNLLGVGGHEATFSFQGSDQFLPSSWTTYYGVYKAPTQVKLSFNQPYAEAGRPATFEALVVNGLSPEVKPGSGVVQFYVGANLAAEVPVDQDGKAVFTTSSLPIGDAVVTAVYMESENFQASQSNLTLPVYLARDPTATKLSSSLSRSTAGTLLAFYADVTGANGGPRPASGLVRFYLGLDPIAEVPIDANGRATLPARFDAPDWYMITAVYLGSAGFHTSQSDNFYQLVQPADARSAVVAQAAASTRTDAVKGMAVAEPAAPASQPTSRERPAVRARLAARAELAARLALRRPPAAALARR